MRIINPFNQQTLEARGQTYVDQDGNEFPVVNGALRIEGHENYTQNFSVQWHRFSQTQLDRNDGGRMISSNRFFAETAWNPKDLDGSNLLEVGSGAGRFSKVVLESTNANLYSVDYSDAVSANFNSNGAIAPNRFHLFQASIYALPFPDNAFDRVVCIGVLQHTPNFEESVRALVRKAEVGGEIVVDFYRVNGWWTKLHAKYILRPVLKRMRHDRLLRLIESNIGWLMRAEMILHRLHLGSLARFLPIVVINGTIPKFLTADEKREWAILDTFDMFSPKYDNPQRLEDVVAMFERCGAYVTFAGNVEYDGGSATVVRAKKNS